MIGGVKGSGETGSRRDKHTNEWHDGVMESRRMDVTVRPTRKDTGTRIQASMSVTGSRARMSCGRDRTQASDGRDRTQAYGRDRMDASCILFWASHDTGAHLQASDGNDTTGVGNGGGSPPPHTRWSASDQHVEQAKAAQRTGPPQAPGESEQGLGMGLTDCPERAPPAPLNHQANEQWPLGGPGAGPADWEVGFRLVIGEP